jgi:hypothetical protein
LIESEWSLHYVRDMLGHANSSQTSTYLNATSHSLQAAIRTLDESREDTPGPSRCKPVASEPVPDHLSDCNSENRPPAQVTVN